MLQNFCSDSCLCQRTTRLNSRIWDPGKLKHLNRQFVELHSEERLEQHQFFYVQIIFLSLKKFKTTSNFYVQRILLPLKKFKTTSLICNHPNFVSFKKEIQFMTIFNFETFPFFLASKKLSPYRQEKITHFGTIFLSFFTKIVDKILSLDLIK